MTRKMALIIAWAMWQTGGFILLFKGVGMVRETNFLMIAALIGFWKGRFVLARSAEKIVARILSLAPPISLRQLFPLRFLLLIALMMGLGLALRFLPESLNLWKGSVRVAVGVALLIGGNRLIREGKKHGVFA